MVRPSSCSFSNLSALPQTFCVVVSLSRRQGDCRYRLLNSSLSLDLSISHSLRSGAGLKTSLSVHKLFQITLYWDQKKRMDSVFHVLLDFSCLKFQVLYLKFSPLLLIQYVDFEHFG